MYVLLHTWEHELGRGIQVVSISADKLALQKLMRKEAHELKRLIQMPGERFGKPILIEERDGSINVRYKFGRHGVWHWEIREVDVLANDSEG